MTRLLPLFGLAALLGACARPLAERPAASPAVPEGSASAAPPLAAPGAPEPATQNFGQTAAPAATAPGVATSPSAPAAPERHGPSLPELNVKSFGLHIGGSAADAAARAEFQRALEAMLPSYYDCYRHIEQPGSVGTFGADLKVGADGGRPHVGKPRTKLAGTEFQSCMQQAFERVSFPRTPSGRPVVVSYSVKFSFGQ